MRRSDRLTNAVQEQKPGQEFTVLSYFVDAQDEGRVYHSGDTYPRQGLKLTKERIEALSTRNNAMGIPLIEKK